MKLLKEVIYCPKCGKTVKLNRASMTFQCKMKKKGRMCNKKVSAREGTFFEKSKLSIPKIVELMCWWAFTRVPRIETLCRETKISRPTVVDWSNYCREVCIPWAMQRSIGKIGGVGKIVEIDEAKFGRRKYNRGRRIEGQWVFGGIERGSNRSFFIPVADRTKETLLKIIDDNILPGNTVMSDCWKAYGGLNDAGFVHFTLNHSIEFVNSRNNTVHTQNIERAWRDLKEQVPKYGRPKAHIMGYLAESQYKKVNAKGWALTNFFPAVAQLYPGLPGP